MEFTLIDIFWEIEFISNKSKISIVFDLKTQSQYGLIVNVDGYWTWAWFWLIDIRKLTKMLMNK